MDVILSNLAAHAAQVTCVAAAGSILPLLLRVDPRVRYHYWRLLLAVCLALPWLQGRVVTPSAAATGVATSFQPLVAGSASQVSGSVAPVPFALASMNWTMFTIAILGTGASLRLLWILAALYRLRRLRTAGEPADAADGHDLQDTLGTRARIRYVRGLGQPVTFGVLHPMVLLPDGLRDHAPDVRRAVLCHELLHVQRRDWAWVLVEEGIRAALWFHPAVWWLLSRVQLTREEVVDDIAVRITGARRTYMEALMAFADETPLAPAAAFSRRRHLFNRIVLLSKETVMSSKHAVLSSLVLCAVVVAGGWFTIGAFPMVEAQAAQQLLPAAGPLEARATPITPENPIPRRIYSVTPQYPVEALNVDLRTATIVLKVTLNGAGRVAEMRRTGFVVFSTRPSASAVISADPMPSVQEALAGASVQGDRSAIGPVVEALFRSSADAVGQWQYDSPAEAPISFFVQLEFKADGTVALTAQSPTNGLRVAGFLVPSTSSTRAAASPRGAAPPPPPPPPPPGAIRVGGNIKAPTKIKDVKPVYPAIAMSARIQGVVIVEGTVGEDGRVSYARVIRSIPLLDQAALDAVRQWEFTPTLLNGVPVPVIMTMTVSFTLNSAQ